MRQFGRLLLLIVILVSATRAQAAPIEGPLAAPGAGTESESPSATPPPVSTLNTTPDSASVPPPPIGMAAPATVNPEMAPEKSDKALFSLGLGYRTTNWSHFESPDNTSVSYNVNTATNTIVEGDVAIPKIGISLGFSATPDGGVSSANRYLGYLGFKGFSLKTETGSFSGSATFSGQVAPGEARTVDFQQVYHYTELDYTFNLSGGFPWLIGLRYTSWNLPAEIALLSTSSSGPTILDPSFQSSFYSLISGFDFFKEQILIGDEKPSSGFGVMGSFLVGIGFGTSQISAATAQNVQTIYGKTLSTTSPGVFTVHLSAQVGPKYSFIWNGFTGVVGFGYDINLLDLLASQTGNGTATPTNQLDPVAYPNFIYQGWILRTAAVF